MSELITTCRTCGREWSPDHSDYVRATWRICPRCRGQPSDRDDVTDTHCNRYDNGAPHHSKRTEDHER